MPLDDPKRENPSELQLEGVSEGIEALPKRIDRYGKAKKGALDVADYMQSIPKHQAMGDKVKSCGDYLIFRHYFTVDRVKLHGASLCRKHLLCPLCAIRRGAKSLAAYLQKWETIKAENPALNAYLVTLTVKDGEDLKERFNHLQKSQKELWKRKSRIYATALDGVVGAVWSYEVKRGKNSGSWHPHLHMIALAENPPDQAALSAEWLNITGDSFIVDVRPISQEDPASGFIEVFKYAVKFSDQPPADTVHAWVLLAGKRLLQPSGCFVGVEVSENLLDDSEGFEGLPYVALFYRYLPGGFSLTGRKSGVHLVSSVKPPKPAKPYDENREAAFETTLRLTAELHERRESEKARFIVKHGSLRVHGSE